MSFRVETDFPGGNACAVSIADSAGRTRISFAPDPHRGPETLWFYFRIVRTAPGQATTIELELQHSCNMLGGEQPQHLRPVIRYSEGDWQRLGAPAIEERPDGRKLVRWEIEAPQSSAEVALCFPYGQAQFNKLHSDVGENWHCDAIGVGQRGNSLLRLANDYGHIGNDRPGIYLMSQQHAGETSGSWALDGFLRRLAELGPAAPLVWAVPLADADGVHSGDYSKDQFPFDINRAWGNPPMRHETLVMRGDVARWAARCRPCLALDFHAPGACEDFGAYCFVPPAARERPFYGRLSDCLEAVRSALTGDCASSEFQRTATYPTRWQTPTFADFMTQAYDIPAAIFEVPYAICGDHVFSIRDYQQVGARFCDAVMQTLLAG